ncbi:hypothetical protein IAQ61_008639 [Plenodomus lingam]|uniref:uncharacterized protein n=1 Tax=Leptosphaeria maculans TaxID=5022 RepID=UPI003325D7BD|nr:hypothetical protein IAQ61_008639 [Plenodomus lingam]
MDNIPARPTQTADSVCQPQNTPSRFGHSLGSVSNFGLYAASHTLAARDDDGGEKAEVKHVRESGRNGGSRPSHPTTPSDNSDPII